MEILNFYQDLHFLTVQPFIFYFFYIKYSTIYLNGCKMYLNGEKRTDIGENK